MDDFLIRYSHPSELDHLVSCLSTLYKLKVHRDLPHYPLYLPRLYYRLPPHLPVTLHGPLLYKCQTMFLPCFLASVPRDVHRPHPQPSTLYTPLILYPDPSIPTTLSILASPAEKTWIQQVVGSLLFYARALDLCVLCSTLKDASPIKSDEAL